MGGCQVLPLPPACRTVSSLDLRPACLPEMQTGFVGVCLWMAMMLQRVVWLAACVRRPVRSVMIITCMCYACHITA